jgi:hypothetical protein
LNSKIVALLNYVIVNQIMMLLLLWKQYYSIAPIVLLMSVAAINYLQWRWKRSHRHRRSRVVALDFNIVAPLNYVIVDQIMMLLLWRRHYSMAPIVVMMSVAAIN